MKKRNLLDRLREKKAQRENIAVGVCWYTAQDWERVKATATDPDLLEDSFSDWEAMADANFAIVRAAYPNAVKVFVSADEFLTWCRVVGRANDSEGRSEFVSGLLRKNDSRALQSVPGEREEKGE